MCNVFTRKPSFDAPDQHGRRFIYLFIYLFLHQCIRRDVIENDPMEDTRATYP